MSSYLGKSTRFLIRPADVITLLKLVSGMSVCVGNPDEKFDGLSCGLDEYIDTYPKPNFKKTSDLRIVISSSPSNQSDVKTVYRAVY